MLKQELPLLTEAVPGLTADLPLQINGVGNFETGGPEGDSGLSGTSEGRVWRLLLDRGSLPFRISSR